MNTEKIILLSYDIFLFSGMKSLMPNLVLVDAQTYIPDAQSITPQYPSCLLVIDNRLPLFQVEKWLQRNSIHLINMKCIVIRMTDSRSLNHGYEKYAFINRTELSGKLITRLKEKLQESAKTLNVEKISSIFNFRLTKYEEKMLHASFTKEKLLDFCVSNSLTIKSIYRHRDKITSRLGFSNFNETIIFLTRNNLLHEGHAINKNVDGNINHREVHDTSDANRLSLAIRNEDIIPYFQPIVSIVGDVYGVEVLARWPQGDNYEISHRELIILAARSGLINELTSYLMSVVADILVTNKSSINKAIVISFNVSSSHLSNPIFYWECLNFLEVTKKSPVRLMIEIIESHTFNITPAIKELIRSLRNKSILFALDDFGTGCANLCYLNELDLDVIKIGQTFIKGIKEAEQHIPMLESIIHLAEVLGLRTVAEGVKYEHQQQWLGKKKVDYLQGHQFSPPMTFNDFISYYKQSGSFIQLGSKNLSQKELSDNR